MARSKNRPGTAPSAAHAAAGHTPAPVPPPAPGSPAAAIHAALAANPGATVTVIAAAAGTGKPAARHALLAMEKAGTATRVSLIGPGPDFDAQYAMGTDPDEPLIIATLTGPDGEPAGPLLIDGCHRLYKGARLGREHLPSLVLSAAENPGHPPRRHPRAAPRALARQPAAKGEQAMTTVTITIFHNIARDQHGRPTGMLDGYQPGDPSSASSPTRPAPPGGHRRRSPERRSPSATATPTTQPTRSCPAAITHASCGRCRSPESRCVAPGCVAFAALRCCLFGAITAPLLASPSHRVLPGGSDQGCRGHHSG